MQIRISEYLVSTFSLCSLEARKNQKLQHLRTSGEQRDISPPATHCQRHRTCQFTLNAAAATKQSFWAVTHIFIWCGCINGRSVWYGWRAHLFWRGKQQAMTLARTSRPRPPNTHRLEATSHTARSVPHAHASENVFFATEGACDVGIVPA